MPIQAVSFKGSEHVSEQAENKKEYTDLEYYQALSDAGLSTMDVYEPVNSEGKKNKKGFLGVALSLATAAVLTFAGGKIVTEKLAKVFPKSADRFKTQLTKLSERGFWDKAKEFLGKHSESAKPAKVKIGKFFQGTKNLFMKKASSGVELVQNGLKSDKAVSNVMGAVVAAAGVSRIATIDGNGDGIKDIAQKNVNAYKNAIQSIDVLDAFAKTIS